jgi:hypothetical protein
MNKDSNTKETKKESGFYRTRYKTLKYKYVVTVETSNGAAVAQWIK